MGESHLGLRKIFEATFPDGLIKEHILELSSEETFAVFAKHIYTYFRRKAGINLL
jgi:hypothetical protein